MIWFSIMSVLAVVIANVGINDVIPIFATLEFFKDDISPCF